MLIAIDGIDGAGKTTLANQLRKILSALNPLIEKEPTDNSHWGKILRESASNGRLSREIELEYFHKDRIHHIETVIKLALEKNKLVILDRYVDSTLAFQAESVDEAESLYQKFLPEILVPEVTFILRCSVEEGLRRIAESRNGNSKFERAETLEHAKEIYESRRGPTYYHLDASKSAKHTLKQAIKILYDRFEELRPYLTLEATSDCSRFAATAQAQ